MIKVSELKASNLKGSSIQILECGAIMLQEGQTLLVPETIAPRLLLQYKGRLLESRKYEKERLNCGHYEVSKEEVNIEEGPKEIEQIKETPIEVIKRDKSMANKSTKRRRKE